MQFRLIDPLLEHTTQFIYEPYESHHLTERKQQENDVLYVVKIYFDSLRYHKSSI